MSNFKFFRGNPPKDRELPEGEGSGLKYRNSSGHYVELTPEEYAELCDSYAAFILKWLWMRDLAANKYHWIEESSFKYASLKERCNGHRDPARQSAFKHGYAVLKQGALITEMAITHDDINTPGKIPARVTMTGRGAVYFKEYQDWYATEFGDSFVKVPRHEQFVSEEGTDKDESTPKFPVPALKNLNIV